MTKKESALAGHHKSSRAIWVYDTLIDRIREGQYSGGERIREEEIARSLGVSRTPVREALSRLQTRGMLEIAPGGLIVAMLTRPQVMELYAMREILEGSGARLAAQHASSSEISALRRLADSFARAVGDPAKQAHINRMLHSAIYEAAHNRYLMRTLYELHDVLALLPGTTFTLPGRAEVAAAEHSSIVDWIEQRDADKAEQEARAHIRKAQEARLEMLSDLEMG